MDTGWMELDYQPYSISSN